MVSCKGKKSDDDKKERKKEKERIITRRRFASCETLHPSSSILVEQTVSYANCHTRTQWNRIRADDPVDDFVPRVSLSLSLISAVALFSTEKREMFISKRSNGFIEVRRVYLGIYHDVAAAAQLCLFKQREMGQKNKKKKSRYRVQRVYEQSKERRKRKIERDFRGIRKHARRIMLYIPWSNSGRAFSTIGDPTFPPHACFFPSLISRREFS